MLPDLDPDFYPALDAFSSVSGVPASWIAIVLYSESALNPTAKNSLGYEGLNQISSSYLHDHKIDPDDYVTWPASEQFTKVVAPFLAAQLKYLGAPITSPGVLYALNFLPGRVKERGTAPTTVLTQRGEGYYNANTGLDVNKDGAITIGDLDTLLYKLQSAKPFVDALQGRALPYSAAPQDPYIPIIANGSALQWGLLGIGAGALIGIGVFELTKNKGRRYRHVFAEEKPRSKKKPKKLSKPLLVAASATALAGGGLAAFLLSRRAEDDRQLQLPAPGAALKFFPVVDTPTANIKFSDDWGQGRSGGRHHQGTDIIASYGTPIIAVDDGHLTFTDDGQPGAPGCPPPLSFHLKAVDGTLYFGTHLSAFIDGANVGDQRDVRAGDVIGYVGHGGNACGTVDHLHFEVHPGGGAPIDPYPLLVVAPRAKAGTLVAPGFAGSLALARGG